MLRGLLRDSEVARELFDKFGLFKSPELLEKYVIAGEITAELLDVLLSRVFGTERGQGSAELTTIYENLFCCASRDKKGASRGSVSPRDKMVEDLHVKVQDMERQICAMQRQLQMQGDVQELAASVDSKLEKIAQECKRQISETDEALRSHVAASVDSKSEKIAQECERQISETDKALRSKVAVVSGNFARLENDLQSKASSEDLKSLTADVSRLKKTLGEHVAGAEKKNTEGLALHNEIQGKLEKLATAVTMIPCHHHIVYDSAKPLNGIIAHLTRMYGGNVHDKGIVKVTVSSNCRHHDSKLENLVDLEADTWFASDNIAESWICYDFKTRRVAPMTYSIKPVDDAYPRKWVFEVSEDGTAGSWVPINLRLNNNDLNDKFVTRAFTIGYSRGSFRFVRLRQTGVNSRGDNMLCMSSFEVFGTLFSE